MKKWIKKKWKWLYLKIVREKASPEYIARGWAIGMFYGCLIPFGFQLLCSIPTAFVLKGSKIGASLGTLLTNHFTIFLIYPLQCWVGNRIIGGDLSYKACCDALKNVLEQQNYQSLAALGGELAAAFFIGGALLTLVMTPLTYYFVKILATRFKSRKKRNWQHKVPASPEHII